MSEYETLLWDLQDAIATITLNRPEKKNAMSWAMFDEIGAAFERAASDREVRCVVVTGAGGSFCTGADLTDPENMATGVFEVRDRMRALHEGARRVIDCPKPTIAKVVGVAAGAGCNLAFGCDLIVASRDATFYEIFVKRGLVVDYGGTWALTRLLPLNKAKELALLGEALTGEQAAQLGIVNRLCEPDEIDAVTKDLAVRLAQMPSRAAALIKANLNRAYERSLQENLDAESEAQAMVTASEDTREAILAWLEKREPRFTGR